MIASLTTQSCDEATRRSHTVTVSEPERGHDVIAITLNATWPRCLPEGWQWDHPQPKWPGAFMITSLTEESAHSGTFRQTTEYSYQLKRD